MAASWWWGGGEGESYTSGGFAKTTVGEGYSSGKKQWGESFTRGGESGNC